MQISTGIEKLGVLNNQQFEIDWDEFNNGITVKERLWSTHQSLTNFFNIFAHLTFWSKLLFNLVNGQSLFIVDPSNISNMFFLIAVCWLSIIVVGKYYKREFPQVDVILLNKYIYPQLQRDLIDSHALPRGNDLTNLLHVIKSDSNCAKLIRINNIKEVELKSMVEKFVEDNRTRNWLSMLLFEAGKKMAIKRKTHISPTEIFEVVTENFSDRNQ